MLPPGPGSGGHGTIFRMAAALERAGHGVLSRLTIASLADICAYKTIRQWWPESRSDICPF